MHSLWYPLAMEKLGNLYIVATPIGNMSDITLRAIEILKNAKYIACEDTRRTGQLLKRLNIRNDQILISFYDQVEKDKIPNILNIVKNGEDVVLVSDSGTPTISDPGFKLVRECLRNNIKVVSIPGPSASISALASSGLPTDKFTFVGFLPRKEGNRNRLLNELKISDEKIKSTIILYEAPHRLIKTLESIKQVFGDVSIVVMRELTKIHEERIENSISKILDIYKKKQPKGEFVILLNSKLF